MAYGTVRKASLPYPKLRENLATILNSIDPVLSNNDIK